MGDTSTHLGHTQCRRILENISVNFPFQLTEKNSKTLTKKGKTLGLCSQKAALAAVTMIGEFSIVKGLEGKTQDHSSGLQISRLGTLHISAWKSPIGKDPGEKRDPRKLRNIKGSPTSFPQQSISKSRKMFKNARRSAWMNMLLLTKLKLKKEA